MRRRAIFHRALAAILVAGCDSAPQGTDQGSLPVPRRDLTLRQLPADPGVVASPIEIPRSERERSAGRPHRARLPGVRGMSRPETPDTGPVSEAAAPAAPEVAAPAPAAPAPSSSSRELAPGQTVTIIPASSGPSVAAEPGDEAPSRAGRAIMRGHGGTCRPRPGGAL